jgi:hypothetical protein
MTIAENNSPRSSIAIHVAESPIHIPQRRVLCQVGKHVEFSTESIVSYCFSNWEPIVYDALLLAAAVEFADRTQHRAALRWEREIELFLPAHDPDRWNTPEVSDALHDTLDFLTGDRWHISFRKRSVQIDTPRQQRFELPPGITTVIPFSDGLDSRAVAGLMANELGEKLVRVRLGTRGADIRSLRKFKLPFAAVPYRVRPGSRQFVESSARSRGFKFALMCGLAAYLAKASNIIVSESGQGSLGPALVAVGQAYEDYRSHPLFTMRMERFLAALFNHSASFLFPRIWQTKAETLAEFVATCKSASWTDTFSCWQQNRQVSVDKKKRQCGICAACMLRRMSIYGAGLEEAPQAYVWEDLGAKTLEEGAVPSFPKKKITGKMRQYAIAGTLHLDHLAALQASPANARTLTLNAFQLSRTLGLTESDAQTKLRRLLSKHESEWKDFVNSLGQNSFVANWAIHARP